MELLRSQKIIFFEVDNVVKNQLNWLSVIIMCSYIQVNRMRHRNDQNLLWPWTHSAALREFTTFRALYIFLAFY